MDHRLAIARSLKGSKFNDYMDALLTMHTQESNQRQPNMPHGHILLRIINGDLTPRQHCRKTIIALTSPPALY